MTRAARSSDPALPREPHLWPVDFRHTLLNVIGAEHSALRVSSLAVLDGAVAVWSTCPGEAVTKNEPDSLHSSCHGRR